MWEWEFSETEFERGWNFEKRFEGLGFYKKIKLRKLRLWKLNFERDQNRKLFEK